MAKTFNKEDGLTYTEFFAHHRTTDGDIDNLRDSDDCSLLLQKYNASNPPDGWFRRYWENENIRYEWHSKDGKQDGVSKSWWPNGDIKSKRNYRDGKLHGLCKGWYENGQVSGIRDFKDGKRDGLWTDYHKSGQVWMKKTYKNGKVISEKYWNEDGLACNQACHKKGELKELLKINPGFEEDPFIVRIYKYLATPKPITYKLMLIYDFTNELLQRKTNHKVYFTDEM